MRQAASSGSCPLIHSHAPAACPPLSAAPAGQRRQVLLPQKRGRAAGAGADQLHDAQGAEELGWLNWVTCSGPAAAAAVDGRAPAGSLKPASASASASLTLPQVVAAGFTPMVTPDIVRESVFEKCGFAPRAENTQVRPAGGQSPSSRQQQRGQEQPAAGSPLLPSPSPFPTDLQHRGNQHVPDGHRRDPAGRRGHGQDPL